MLRRWRLRVGNEGEDLAARHLRRQGMKILARQYRCPLGEIDLIARDDRTIVFVEVKTHSGTRLGDPTQSITFDKQRRLTRLAEYVIARKRWHDRPARFDVVAIILNPPDPPEVRHIRHAFEAV